MADASRRETILGLPMDLLTMDESVQACVELMRAEKFAQHVVVNAAKIVAAHDDPELARIISACDLINIDGMSVVFAGRLIGHPVPERVAGIDLMERLLEACEREGLGVYFLGASEDTLALFTAEALARFPDLIIAGSHHGYFENDHEVAAEIGASGARLLLVGISSPRKERFIHGVGTELGPLLAMGVGGSFDVWAGKTRRAPKLLQRVGLEWFYRVIQEPRRMWRRYLFCNTRFVLLTLRELLAAKRPIRPG